jgi:hypothetical protein
LYDAGPISKAVVLLILDVLCLRYLPSRHSRRSILLQKRLFPLHGEGMHVSHKREPHAAKAVNVHVFARDTPVVLRPGAVHALGFAEHLHEFFVVRDAYQLEVLLGRASVQDTTQQCE